VPHLVVQVVAAQVAEDGEDDLYRQGKARKVVLGIACAHTACRSLLAMSGMDVTTALFGYRGGRKMPILDNDMAFGRDADSIKPHAHVT